MQNTSRTSWVDISLFILGLLGILFYLGIGFVMAFSGLLGIANSVDSAEAAQPILLGVMFGLIGFLLVPGAWILFRNMTGRLEPDREARLPFALWHIPIILIIWAIGLLAGQWAVDAPSPAWMLLPMLIPLSVFPPIWLMLGLAGRGYDFRPRWRNWNALTIGATLGPFLILITEVIVLAVLLVVVILFIVSQPEMTAKLELLSTRMRFAQTEQELLAVMGPLAASPAFIGVVLLAVSILVPLIEELLKPLAVWLFARQLNTRLDGFVLGAICGAAYAIFETGGISPAAGGDWLTLLGARGGTSLLHVATSAWMGSAIVPAMRERKILQLLGVFAMSILLHGTWNAFSIFNGLGPAAIGQPGGEWIVAAGRFSVYGLGALATLFLALIIYQQNRFEQQHNQLATAVIAPGASLPTSEPESLETVIR